MLLLQQLHHSQCWLLARGAAVLELAAAVVEAEVEATVETAVACLQQAVAAASAAVWVRQLLLMQ
jgi:hypothetical protein